MPEAIATTKRKFYKALDAITNPSQSSLKQSTTTTASAANEATPSNKRSSTVAAAFDEARERARKRLRQSTSTTSLSTLDQRAAVISIPRSKTTKDSRPPPHFAPWSQERFLARLKTFSSVSQWHPKPDAINEVEWAKQGWVCVDLNTVACKGGCGKRVVVSLDKEQRHTSNDGTEAVDDDHSDEEGAAFEQALSERYRSEIISGHASSCMWHKAGCKDDIYRLHVVRPSVWQPELRNRCQSLQSILPSIQNIKTRPLDDSSEKLLHDLPKDIFGLESSPDPKAFQIALHGWRGSSESGTQLLHCDACFQRIGLWMYQPDYHSGRSTSTTLNADAGDEGDEEEDQTTIDLVDMHRDHCPWRSADSQSATGSLAGLNAIQILRRVVSTCARDHRRRSEEHAMVFDDATQRGEEEEEVAPVVISREETERRDKERESKLRKLKNLFNFQRKPNVGKATLGKSVVGNTMG